MELLQLVGGQMFTLSSIEYDDDCRTASVTFEIQPTGSFSFIWFAVNGAVEEPLAAIVLLSSGAIIVSNKSLENDDYEIHHYYHLMTFPTHLIRH